MSDQVISSSSALRTALVTGAAGFIGYHVATRLLEQGWQVVGLDCFSDYYDVELKNRRYALLVDQLGFVSVTGHVEENGLLLDLFSRHKPELVIHLAAQAGVRNSIERPRDYVEANLIGVFELLEAARAHPPAHMLLASTSSVYGANTEMPYGERDKADTQMSFYAATKKATESMAHSYAHLYGVPVTMFRFFTVYGPWGRPDMAPFLFTDAIMNGRPIKVFNHGKMRRDFTYIDDLVDGICGLSETPPGTDPVSELDSLSPVAPFRVVNIGNNQPVQLMDFITAVERVCGRTAEKIMYPMQPGDVHATWADIRLLQSLTGYEPKVDLATGVKRFVDWYAGYYELDLAIS